MISLSSSFLVCAAGSLFVLFAGSLSHAVNKAAYSPSLFITAPRIPPKPFEDEDGEVESISDAGSIDSIDSNHSEPPELENPMSRIATAAMEELHTGEGLVYSWRWYAYVRSTSMYCRKLLI